MLTEADTRIIIDRLLREAHWNVENKSVVSTEEPAADGRADYQGARARAEALFGRERLTAIMQELNDLIATA